MWFLGFIGMKALQSCIEPSIPDNSKTKHKRLMEVSKKIVLNMLRYLEINNDKDYS